MGCSESKSTTKKKIQKEQIIINNEQNINQKHLRHNESMIDPKNPFVEFKPDYSKRLSKEICKIVIESKYGRIIGTGFFLFI